MCKLNLLHLLQYVRKRMLLRNLRIVVLPEDYLVCSVDDSEIRKPFGFFQRIFFYFESDTIENMKYFLKCGKQGNFMTYFFDYSKHFYKRN